MQAKDIILIIFLFNSCQLTDKPSSKKKDLNHNTGLSYNEYTKVISEIKEVYEPIFSEFPVVFDIPDMWGADALNPKAIKNKNKWSVHLYGGLARSKDMTKDIFTLFACHEIGHFLGGFPFVKAPPYQEWISSEGQADYYAAHVCIKKIWETKDEENNIISNKVNTQVKEYCKSKIIDLSELNLCIRTINAFQQFSNYIANSMRAPLPSINKKDPKIVEETRHKHPKPQCRLDTLTAAYFCEKKFDAQLIPGFEFLEDALEAEKQSHNHICYDENARPKCWFKSILE